MLLAWSLAFHRAEFGLYAGFPWFNLNDGMLCQPAVLTSACLYLSANWNTHLPVVGPPVEPAVGYFYFDDISPASFRRGIEWLDGFGDMVDHAPDAGRGASPVPSSLVLGAWTFYRQNYGKHTLRAEVFWVTGGSAQRYEGYASVSAVAPLDDAAPTMTTTDTYANLGPFAAGSTVYCWVRAVDTSGLKTSWGEYKSYSLPSFGTPPSLGIAGSFTTVPDGNVVIATSTAFASGGYNYRHDGSFSIDRVSTGSSISIYFQYNDGAGWLTSKSYYDIASGLTDPYTMSPTNRQRFFQTSGGGSQYRLIATAGSDAATFTINGSLTLSGV